MNEQQNGLSQTVKNFLTQFERDVLPHINTNKNKSLNQTGYQSVMCYVSAATLEDPQLKELVRIKPGEPVGRFMGVRVEGKPDMLVEVINKGIEE